MPLVRRPPTKANPPSSRRSGRRRTSVAAGFRCAPRAAHGRRRAFGANHTAVDAAQVVCRTDRDAIREIVAAALRSKPDVMIVKLASSAARGDRAAPTIAREHRIVVPWLAFPVGDHGLQQSL